MNKRLARMEEMLRATERALAALQEGDIDRLEVAATTCGQALDESVSEGDPDFRAVADPSERKKLQEGFSRLNELTQLCRQEGERVRASLTKGQQRAGEVRHFLEASRSATEQRTSEFDQEG